MLASVGALEPEAMAARMGSLGLQILPLLTMINTELSLGLKMPEIKRQLQQRARAEDAATDPV
jgi:uncharacterized membrane protein YGL010W